jgi:phage portal protein, HK97 family
MANIIDRLFNRRSISFQTLWGSGEDIVIGTQSGTYVTQDNVFKVNAIFSAVALIADTISTLPLDAYIRIEGERRAFRPRPAWVQKPDVDLISKEPFYNSVIVSLLLDGNAFIRVYRDSAGRVLNLVTLNPQDVEVTRNSIGRVMYRLQANDELLSSDQVLHIIDVLKPGHIRGISRVEALKENFGLAIALESYAARFFGQGVSMAGHIEFPGNLTPEQAKDLSDGFSARHGGFKKSHKVGVLSAGARFVSTSIENDKAQFLDSRRMAVEDVARAFNIPTNLLGLPGTNTYSSVEQNNIAFVTHTLRPIIQKLEGAFSTLLNTEPGGEFAFIKFSIDGLLRGDANSRFSAYSNGLQSGWLTLNDVRRFEDLSPLEGGETARVPLSNIALSDADVVAQDRKVLMASRLVNAGYDPAEVLAALGIGAIEHTGVPPVMLQGIAQIDPEDPQSVYEV